MSYSYDRTGHVTLIVKQPQECPYCRGHETRPIEGVRNAWRCLDCHRKWKLTPKGNPKRI